MRNIILRLVYQQDIPLTGADITVWAIVSPTLLGDICYSPGILVFTHQINAG
ncbi:hypothetical protein [Serratia fonticola]|uniref:hypothetical protein n=1 Tax=Serratia fonticola TaxID=47917 RepID=UPI002DBE88DB|nr:hypothetical protein [Serratia fonticola]MEB7886674.1 hypothetical protein [Serratia fonticola]